MKDTRSPRWLRQTVWHVLGLAGIAALARLVIVNWPRLTGAAAEMGYVLAFSGLMLVGVLYLGSWALRLCVAIDARRHRRRVEADVAQVTEDLENFGVKWVTVGYGKTAHAAWRGKPPATYCGLRLPDTIYVGAAPKDARRCRNCERSLRSRR